MPLCFVTTCIKKDNFHGQFKGAYISTHFPTALLTTCLKMNMGAFQKLDFVCKGCEARRGFWLSKMYEKEAPMENHHMPKLSVERGRSSLATRNQIFLFIWRSYSLPPKKLYNESSPIPPYFLCKYEAMTTFINSISQRKPYIPCLCQKARKEMVALAVKLSNFPSPVKGGNNCKF